MNKGGRGNDTQTAYRRGSECVADCDIGGHGIRERRLAEDAVRPVIFYPRGGTCRLPWVKALTIMVNSIHNGWRFEDVWLDK
jgi:hypothetical protein